MVTDATQMTKRLLKAVPLLLAGCVYHPAVIGSPMATCRAMARSPGLSTRLSA
jgi:hypothetical protein